MRKEDEKLRAFINEQIESNSEEWIANKGSNFGIPLQRLVKRYYDSQKEELGISTVTSNENPNSNDPDIVIEYNDGSKDYREVKSCKNGKLEGVTICNSPDLLSDSKTFLINYSPNNSTGVINVNNVFDTQLHRLTGINSTGKYRGCLRSTRDTGKKIKGRSYSDFVSTNDEDDTSLEQLTDPSVQRQTILRYSASKLVDGQFNFSDEEILEAIHSLKQK